MTLQSREQAAIESIILTVETQYEPSEIPTLTPDMLSRRVYTHIIIPTLPPFTPTPAITNTPTLPADFFHGSLKYEDVPLISQFGLFYGGHQTRSGCTAASIAMIMAFWNQIDDEYKTMTAQEIINVNTRQGKFIGGTGLATLDVEDELNNLGYHLGVRRNSYKEELLAALERYGPISLLVKTNWDPNGYNHSAVLVAYDEETDKVTINDPWVTLPVTMRYDAFDQIWGLDYSQEEGLSLRRTFFFIVPKEEIRPGGIDYLIPY